MRLARLRVRSVKSVAVAAGVALVAALAAVSVPTTSSANPTVVSAGRYGLDPSTATRYSLVHGCFAITLSDGVQRGPYRMQATRLGEYLLYDTSKGFLADGSAGRAEATAPSKAIEWRVDGTLAQGYTLTNLATGYQSSVTFRPANGCAVYPEVAVGATGNTFKGTNPSGPVFGTIDAHSHVTGFELFGGDWHCGKPWDPYGAPYALPASCADKETGTNGAIESFLDWGTPGVHDMSGWPTFANWPSRTALAEEGDYWTGIERAWLAGLRMITVDFVDNEALCDLMTVKHNACNDMLSVQNQWNDLHAMQDYIDAEAGGPGLGFFRIVTSPAEARQVVNSGKLAVIQGIEVSDVMNCGEILNIPKCTTSDVDAWTTKLWNMGIRSFFPIHKFDNAFGGTKMDGGTTGVIVNVGNQHETGTFWNVQPCTTAMTDQQQLEDAGAASPIAAQFEQVLGNLIGGALLPVYPSGPSCNVRGLTGLGTYVIQQMVKKHFVIELDHMDVKTAQSVLALLGTDKYAGVVSSHSWDSPQQNPAIYALGGFITPIQQDVDSFIASWRADAAAKNPKYLFGFGYGSDMNGLSEQAAPDAGHPISYPFTGYGSSVSFNRFQWGQRTFDLNKDGIANYGMYADWLNEVEKAGGPALTTSLFNGAEAYLQMWQRANSWTPPTA